mmetsp:Transcript_9386/g.14306  ORF Transcript_9386/g.14306 Transcript_9386/m.14306 type:complete len:95 (+) Transcript_9386:329-613(+)
MAGGPSGGGGGTSRSKKSQRVNSSQAKRGELPNLSGRTSDRIERGQGTPGTKSSKMKMVIQPNLGKPRKSQNSLKSSSYMENRDRVSRLSQDSG